MNMLSAELADEARGLVTMKSLFRVCTKCLRALPERDFYRRGGRGGSKRPGALMTQCKECMKKDKKEWANKNKLHTTYYAKKKYDLNKAALSDSYLKILITHSGRDGIYTPTRLLMRDVIELKRLQMALVRYAKEHK